MLRPTCPKTMGVSTFIACGSEVPEHVSVHCVDCVEGKNYSSFHDEKPFQPCLSCQANEAIKGKCSVAEDTTVCKGVCKRGFYPENNSLANCTPCSKCHGKKSLLNQKCFDDNMPREMQCEQTILPVVTTVSTQETPSEESGRFTGKTDEHQPPDEDYKHFKMYKFGFIGAVVTLGLILLRFIRVYCWKKYCKRCQRKRRVSNPESLPLQSTTVEG